MISPRFFLVLCGLLALAAASPAFYQSNQNYYQQPYQFQNFYQQPYQFQNFYQYQHYPSFYQNQGFYPNFYQNQGFYDYPKSPLPVEHFTPYPVHDRLGWGTVAGLLAPVVGNLISNL